MTHKAHDTRVISARPGACARRLVLFYCLAERSPMYEVDESDRVIELAGIPGCSIGAPVPFVMSDGKTAVLAYYLDNMPEDWDGSWTRVVGPTTEHEPVALVRFHSCSAHLFGPPHEDVIAEHPLASRGLFSYGAFEVMDSWWIRRVTRMLSVYRASQPLRHVIFTFHDETFECICEEFEVKVTRGSIAGLIPEMTKLFRWRAEY